MEKNQWLSIATMLNFSNGEKSVISHWHNVKFLQIWKAFWKKNARPLQWNFMLRVISWQRIDSSHLMLPKRSLSFAFWSISIWLKIPFHSFRLFSCFSVTKDYVRLLKYGDSLYRCKQLKRAAMGRWDLIWSIAVSWRQEKLKDNKNAFSRRPSIYVTHRSQKHLQ